MIRAVYNNSGRSLILERRLDERHLLGRAIWNRGGEASGSSLDRRRSTSSCCCCHGNGQLRWESHVGREAGVGTDKSEIDGGDHGGTHGGDGGGVLHLLELLPKDLLLDGLLEQPVLQLLLLEGGLQDGRLLVLALGALLLLESCLDHRGLLLLLLLLLLLSLLKDKKRKERKCFI